MNPAAECIPPALTIYTIGHGNTPFPLFLDLLRRHAIGTLVDVRSSPYSRYASKYNREHLESNLKKAGVNYHFVGEYLGGRPQDATCYKNGEIPQGKVDYLHLVDYPTVMTRDFFIKGIQRPSPAQGWLSNQRAAAIRLNRYALRIKLYPKMRGC